MSNQKLNSQFDLSDGKNYKTKFDITKKYGMEKAIKFYNKLEKFGFIIHLSPTDLFKRLEEEDHKEFLSGEEIKTVYYVFGINQSCYAGIDKEIFDEEEGSIELDSEKVFNCLYLNYSGPAKMTSNEASKLIEDISSQQNIIIFKDASYKIAIPRHPVPTDPNIYLDGICKKLNGIGFGIKLDETFVGNKDKFKYLFLSTSDNLYIGAFDSMQIFFEKNINMIEIDALSIFNNNREILIVDPEYIDNKDGDSGVKTEYEVKHSNLINLEESVKLAFSKNSENLDKLVKDGFFNEFTLNTNCDFNIGESVYSYSRKEWGEIYLKDEKHYYVKFAGGHPPSIYGLDGSCTMNRSRDLFYDVPIIIPPKKPLPNLEVDTKVLVWNSPDDENSKEKRYFSHFAGGLCWTFRNGQTSWSTDNETLAHWAFWELVE